MKAVTRREFMFDAFTKDTFKSVFSAYREFNKARDDAMKLASCDDAGRRIGKNSKPYLEKFFKNTRKEG